MSTMPSFVKIGEGVSAPWRVEIGIFPTLSDFYDRLGLTPVSSLSAYLSVLWSYRDLEM